MLVAWTEKKTRVGLRQRPHAANSTPAPLTVSWGTQFLQPPCASCGGWIDRPRSLQPATTRARFCSPRCRTRRHNRRAAA